MFLLQESRDGGYEGMETLDEPAVKVGKPQELLQVPDGLWDRPGGDSVHLLRFHSHSLWYEPRKETVVWWKAHFYAFTYRWWGSRWVSIWQSLEICWARKGGEVDQHIIDVGDDNPAQHVP